MLSLTQPFPPRRGIGRNSSIASSMALALVASLGTACIADYGEPDPALALVEDSTEGSAAELTILDPILITPGTADLSERRLMTPTGWSWYTGVSAAQLADKVADGYRIFDLEVESTSPYLFSAALVRNQGDHQKTWWWYYGKTSSEISSLLQQNQARIIDLEIDFVDGVKRYAAVMVSNTGSTAKSWWYYSQLTFDQVGDKVAQNSARIIDLDTYVYNGVRYYDAVMIANQGVDAMGWWYYSGLSASEVSAKLSLNQARITDIEVRYMAADGPRFAVVMERSEGQTWWWYHGKTMSEVSDLTAQNGARIIDIEPYDTSAGKRFAVVMLRNTNDLTDRMRRYLAGNRSGGAYGLRLERIAGATLASLQSDRPFYAASTIKALVHARAMKSVELGTYTLATSVTKYPAASDSCSDSHAGQSSVIESLDTAMRKMMENSDNQSTNALQELIGSGSAAWGRYFINLTAHGSLGMSDASQLAHKLGCGGPSNNPANSLTLRDLGQFYEHTATDFFTNAGNRDIFYDRMLNSRGVGMDAIIDQEAAALGVSASVVSSFKSNIRTAGKAGSYTTGSGIEYNSVGGWIRLPFATGNREYSFGLFIDEATSIASGFSIWTARAELLRDEIRAGLASYL